MLSICITVYNLENYIDETLRSVFSQNTQHEIEVIIGDDGSTDGTLERIKIWERRYPKIIRIYSMPRDTKKKYNAIFRASLNRINLLHHANGEYITFLDGDDLYSDENFYEKAINVLEDPSNHDCVLCCGSTDFYYPDGRIAPFLKSAWIPGKMSVYDYWENHYTHAEAAIIRNVFKIPDRYEEVFDDNLILFYALQSGKYIYCLPNSVVNYRQKPQGNFLDKSLMEIYLYTLGDMEIELAVAPKFWKASLARHREEILYVKKFYHEITKQNYPDVYEYANHLGLESILDIYNLAENGIGS